MHIPTPSLSDAGGLVFFVTLGFPLSVVLVGLRYVVVGIVVLVAIALVPLARQPAVPT